MYDEFTDFKISERSLSLILILKNRAVFTDNRVRKKSKQNSVHFK